MPRPAPLSRSEPRATPGLVERTVAAARRHFFTHGIRSVTMDDLAAELGMSKKTLYGLFSSKTDLLKAVLMAKFREVESDLSGIASNGTTDVLASLRELLACMRRHTEEIQPPFVRDMQREAPEIFAIVQGRRRDLIQRHFGKLFEAGRRAGIIRKDLSSRLMIEILLGATESIMNPPKLAELDLTPKEGYLTITTVILEGVLTDKGRKDRQGDRETSSIKQTRKPGVGE